MGKWGKRGLSFWGKLVLHAGIGFLDFFGFNKLGALFNGLF